MKLSDAAANLKKDVVQVPWVPLFVKIGPEVHLVSWEQEADVVDTQMHAPKMDHMLEVEELCLL